MKLAGAIKRAMRLVNEQPTALVKIYRKLPQDTRYQEWGVMRGSDSKLVRYQDANNMQAQLPIYIFDFDSTYKVIV